MLALQVLYIGEVELWNMIKDGKEERKIGGEKHEFREAKGEIGP